MLKYIFVLIAIASSVTACTEEGVGPLHDDDDPIVTPPPPPPPHGK
jgi:hypothetical protein